MVLLAALALPALAADPVVLPGAPLVAGEPGTVELWAPELSAQARLKGQSDLGRVGVATPVGDGRWLLPVTPSARVEEQLTVLLSIRDGEDRDDVSLSVPVQPAAQGALRLVAPAGGVVLGRDAGLDLQVVPVGTSHQALADRHLLLRSTLGTLGAPAPDGDAGWTVRWTPPRSLDAPAYALVSVADAAAPSRVLGWTAIPLSRQTRVEATVEPDATCTLVAGSVESSPARADGRGAVELDVVLHPAVSRGTLRCAQAGAAPAAPVERAVPLPAGQDPWVGWLPLPPQVPAGATIPIQAVVIEDDGQPRAEGSAPRLDVPQGAASTLELVATGLYAGTWTAPAEPGAVALGVELHGRVDAATVQVVPPGTPSSLPPARVAAWAQPSALPEGGGSTVVLASALDAVGLPVPRAVLEVEALPGAAIKSTRTTAGKDGRAAVRVEVGPGAPWSGLAVRVAGAEDTALVAVGAPAPVEAAGTGPDELRAARAALAAGAPAPVALAPAGVAEARAAAGEATAVDAVRTGRARDERGAPWLRVGLAVGTVPHTFHQEAEEGDAGLPATVDADQGDLLAADPLGAPAVDLRVAVQPASLPVGLDLRAQGRAERYRVVGDEHRRTDLQLVGGLRAAVPVTPDTEPFLLAQVEVFRAPVFAYDTFREDDPTKATGSELLTSTVVGARLGGGAVLRFGAVQLDLEATETFAPWPVHTRVGAAVEYALVPELAVRGGVDLGFRSMEFDLGADRAHVTDQQHLLSVGLVYLAR